MAPENAPIQLAARLVVGLVLILILSYGRPVLMPLALAAVLAFMLTPIVGWVTRLGLPRPAAVALVMAALLGVTLLGSAVFSSQVLELTASLSTYRTNISEKMKTVAGLGAESGALKRAVDSIEALQREFAIQVRKPPIDDNIRVVVDEEPASGLAGMLRAVESTVGPLEILLLTFVYATVLLAEQYDIVDRVVRLAGVKNLSESTSALSDAGGRISRLFLAQAVINVAFGSVMGLGLWLLGIPNAALWAMAAAVLRFLPWIGVVLAAAPPLLLASAVSPDWGLFGAALALYVVTELALSHVIEPVVLGRHTGLSPLAVITAVSFWWMIWGPVGLLLSGPLTVALVVIGDYVPQLKFLGLLLGDQPPLSPAQEYYRRLLSDDAAAAAERFEKEMKAQQPADAADALVLPALRLAARDQRDERVSGAKAQEIGETMDEVKDILSEFFAKQESSVSPVSLELQAERIFIPAHGPIDRIAAGFAAFILSRTTGAPCRVSEQASGMLALASLKEDGAPIDTIMIVTVGGVSRSHLRLLARRAIADFPKTRIVLCDWSAADADSAAEKAMPPAIIPCVKLSQANTLLHYRAPAITNQLEPLLVAKVTEA